MCIRDPQLFFLAPPHLQAVACTGYASLGDSVQGSILDSYPQAPAWVINMANAMVLIHMVPAFQVR